MELASLNSELANERAFHIDTLLDNALPPTHHRGATSQWTARLGGDFAK